MSHTHKNALTNDAFCWEIKFSSFQIIIVVHFHKNVLQCTIHFQIWKCSQYIVQAIAWARGNGSNPEFVRHPVKFYNIKEAHN